MFYCSTSQLAWIVPNIQLHPTNLCTVYTSQTYCTPPTNKPLAATLLNQHQASTLLNLTTTTFRYVTACYTTQTYYTMTCHPLLHLLRNLTFQCYPINFLAPSKLFVLSTPPQQHTTPINKSELCSPISQDTTNYISLYQTNLIRTPHNSPELFNQSAIPHNQQISKPHIATPPNVPEPSMSCNQPTQSASCSSQSLSTVQAT